MDKVLIEAFWKQRATLHDGRWTAPDMLDHEVAMLRPQIGEDYSIIDLGSGPAVLSLRLLGQKGKLTVVDKHQDFLAQIKDDPRIIKVCKDLLAFEFRVCYDLALLFGVVTHLEKDEEMKIYRSVAKALTQRGSLVVKNQVSRFAEKQVDSFSTELGCHYVGRYPSIAEQLSRLQLYFHEVALHPYPAQFDKWSDTTHLAFVCSNPIHDTL